MPIRSRACGVTQRLLLLVLAALVLVGCSTQTESEPASPTSEDLFLIPPPCGAQGQHCCHAPASSTNLAAYGPLVHCNQGLGCDVQTNRCTQPCGGNAEACCDGPETRALRWTSQGQVYSPTGWGLRPMCDRGACDKASHLCIPCGSVAGASCCPPDASQATARCVGDNLVCQYDLGTWASGTCGACGIQGSAPCTWGCNGGLGVRNGLCDVCGGDGQPHCDPGDCDTGCASGLKVASGLCSSTCGGLDEPPCDVIDTSSPICMLHQAACNPILEVRHGLCEVCGGDTQPICDSGCDAGLKKQGDTCMLCGDNFQKLCNFGCDIGLGAAHGQCRYCGRESQVPCDSGCISPMAPASGLCHYCGGNNEVPCDGTGCKPGFSLQGHVNVCFPNDPPPADIAEDQPCWCKDPGNAPCCAAGLRCGYKAGAVDTVCTRCANANESCFSNNLDCCAGQGDCVQTLASTQPICTDVPTRCLDSGNKCNQLGPGGTHVVYCCNDPDSGAATACPATGTCPF